MGIAGIAGFIAGWMLPGLLGLNLAVLGLALNLGAKSKVASVYLGDDTARRVRWGRLENAEGFVID